MSDTLANALISLQNNEVLGKQECEIRPASKLVKALLEILKREKYVGDFEFIEDGKAGFFKIRLQGKINKSKAIKPRYSVQTSEFAKFEKRYLPARGVGLLIVSTPQGILTHVEAKQQHTGGKLLGFVY